MSTYGKKVWDALNGDRMSIDFDYRIPNGNTYYPIYESLQNVGPQALTFEEMIELRNSASLKREEYNVNLERAED